MNPYISIVTVSLDAAATIDDSLLSVARQRAEFEFEHICVDGGSKDGTRALIDRRARQFSRIHRIFEPDRGIFDAMNKGLAASRGEYVLYLNADDFLVTEDTLARAMRDTAPGRTGNPDLILGDATMGIQGRFGFWRHRRVPPFLDRLRETGCYPVHQGQFTKRSLLTAIGGFDASQRLAADVNQFYDFDRMLRPTMRLLRFDVAFMQADGAANAGVRAMAQGTAEIYRAQARTRGRRKAAAMVAVKTLQSLSELRFGRCPQRRWFGRAPDDATSATPAS